MNGLFASIFTSKKYSTDTSTTAGISGVDGNSSDIVIDKVRTNKPPGPDCTHRKVLNN